MKRISLSYLVFAVAAAGCSDPEQREVLEPGPPGLSSEPQWLTFTCVEPGCSDQLTARIRVEGGRDVAVVRVVLSEANRTDFAFEVSEETPFVLDRNSSFDVSVTYTPTGDPRLGDVDLIVTFTDASASETDDDRIEPGELRIPLVRRLIGEPKLTVSPSEIVFGAVPVTNQRVVNLTLRNTGSGNFGLVVDSVRTDFAEEVRVENVPRNPLLPDDTWDMRVIYEPVAERFIQGFVTITPVGANELPVSVPFVGTSVADPNLEVSPEAGIDFGEVAVGGSAMAKLRLSNGGGEDLVIGSVRFDPAPTRATIGLEGPAVTGSPTISSLASADIDLTFDAVERGELRTDLVIESNDPRDSAVRIPVQALITRPEIRVEPTAIDFGAVPRGWTVVRPIEISNAGYGDLVITDLGLVLGSSELFTLRQPPNFPIVLRHEQRVGLEIEFRADAEASFNATLSIDSNDANNPFFEVDIGAEGASCERGCPIDNGIPNCTGGICAIGTCNENWYDADADASTGCECAEIGTDPGEFCADAPYLGRLEDDGDRATFTGILPEDGDRDVIRFFAYDESGFFTDAFDVRVSLESTDPGIQMCVYRHQTDTHLNECFFENESCPTNGEFRRDGDFGRDDSGDYIIRVFRDPNTPPTCTTYTLFIRNG